MELELLYGISFYRQTRRRTEDARKTAAIALPAAGTISAKRIADSPLRSVLRKKQKHRSASPRCGHKTRRQMGTKGNSMQHHEKRSARSHGGYEWLSAKKGTEMRQVVSMLNRRKAAPLQRSSTRSDIKLTPKGVEQKCLPLGKARVVYFRRIRSEDNKQRFFL